MEPNGILKFTYVHYYTVDEKGLPSTSHFDGDRDRRVESICCDGLESFRYYNSIDLTKSNEYTKSKNKDWNLNLELGGYDYDVEIDVPCCPWCQAKPILEKRNTIKKIKICEEKVIPEHKEQVCKIVESIKDV